MSNIKKYIIDFTKAESRRDIHLIIAEALSFPEWYGCNLDALGDLLTDMVLSERSYIEIYGLEKLKAYNGYDRKIYEAFLGAKHAYGKEEAYNFQVRIVWGDGNIETLADELPKRTFLLDFTKSKTEDDVISEFVNSFGFDTGDTRNFADIWQRLLQALFIRVSIVKVLGIEKLKSIGNTYEMTLKILNGIKVNWDNKYSDRFYVTYLYERIINCNAIRNLC